MGRPRKYHTDAELREARRLVVQRFAERHPEQIRKWRRAATIRRRHPRPKLSADERARRKLVRKHVARAIARGVIARGPCRTCGVRPAFAHHPNGYGPDHELDVEWYCRAHHEAAHKALRAA